tara:strand:- start:875 stop:1246 length:372 start_codon:yes stop_codon:yes gene_type:complete
MTFHFNDNMRDKITAVMNGHDTQLRTNAAVNDFEYVDGHNNHMHTLHANAIIAALPGMIEPLVWELVSPNDQPYWSAKGYKIQSMPHDTWEWNGRCFTCLSVAQAVADADHVLKSMEPFGGVL